MEIAEIIITKPGGITTAEALVKKLPMIIINPIPGQEAKNTEYLLSQNVAVEAEDAKDVMLFVDEFLRNPRKLWTMREAAAALGRPALRGERRTGNPEAPGGQFRGRSMKYYWLKFAELLARLFPRRMSYGIARRFADLYVLFDKRGRESVIGNLRQIQAGSGVALSPRALHSLARENFLNFAKYLVDFFKFLRLNRRRIDQIVHFGNVPAVLDDLLAHGKGVIFLSAHLGNWELGAAALAALGYKLNTVALQVPDKKLDDLYRHYRASRGIYPHTLWARGAGMHWGVAA